MRFRFYKECAQRQFDDYWDTGAPVGNGDFHAEIVSYQIGSLSIDEINTTPYWIEKAGVGNCNNVFICIQKEGELLVEAAGEQYCFVKDDAFIICTNHASRMTVKADTGHYNNYTAIAIPQKIIEKVFGFYNFKRPILIPAKEGVNAAFLDMLKLFCRHASAVEAETDGQNIAAEHLVNSLVNSLAAVLYSLPNPQIIDCSNHDIHRNKIRQFVKANLHTELNLGKIAKAVYLSPRYVHSLFSTEPVTLMKWVMNERLDRCRRELGSCSPGRSIKEIAYSWGFKGQVHFSHAFRKRFGISPKEYRALHTLTAPVAAEYNEPILEMSPHLNGAELFSKPPAGREIAENDQPFQWDQARKAKDIKVRTTAAFTLTALLSEIFIEYFDFFPLLPI
jgi:AraC-like DNA-binding protein